MTQHRQRFRSKFQLDEFMRETDRRAIEYVNDYFARWRRPVFASTVYRRLWFRFRAAETDAYLDRFRALHEAGKLVLTLGVDGSYYLSPGNDAWKSRKAIKMVRG